MEDERDSPLLGFPCRKISFLDLRDSLTRSAGVGKGRRERGCDVTIHLPSLGRGTDPRASGGILNLHQTCPRTATESNVSSRLPSVRISKQTSPKSVLWIQRPWPVTQDVAVLL
ncbi:hypothetical protein TNIN_26431 [Trichonephila inaurata madagascariensis]|uniref:Uncharacterized protein n=1 Tax=Trichonephila inaurata madagascariensis TaxID=2747483 RepID=A0A8X6I6H7_9ARAC|nr:hypothetical protein TNIN_26431 [Trichonephila inaurata madagascariensis]